MKIANDRTSIYDGGYTLIELTLSMVFVAFIVTILATSLTNIMQSYNKGVWLTQINEAGRQLSRDVSSQVKYSGVPTAAAVGAISSHQRFCIGGISYLWNTQDQIDNKTAKNYFNGENASNTTLRLVKIDDDSGEYCTTKLNDAPDKSNSKVRVLLGTGVAVYEMGVTQGIGGNDKIPLLTMNLVVGTKGFDRPIKVKNPDSNDYGIVVPNSSGIYPSNSNNRWQCGTWIDSNGDGKVSGSDTFEPSRNQRCAFLNLNYTVYERVQPES